MKQTKQSLLDHTTPLSSSYSSGYS